MHAQRCETEQKSVRLVAGGMAEWLKAAVLKTVSVGRRSGVRIPLPPPDSSACPEPSQTFNSSPEKVKRGRLGDVSQLRPGSVLEFCGKGYDARTAKVPMREALVFCVPARPLDMNGGECAIRGHSITPQAPALLARPSHGPYRQRCGPGN
jgi:hypothetical protein